MRALTTAGAVIFRNGIASGNLVVVHMMVSKYSLPDLLLGSGPTMSTNTLLKGSSKAGIGFNGALGIFGLVYQ